MTRRRIGWLRWGGLTARATLPANQERASNLFEFATRRKRDSAAVMAAYKSVGNLCVPDLFFLELADITVHHIGVGELAGYEWTFYPRNAR